MPSNPDKLAGETHEGPVSGHVEATVQRLIELQVEHDRQASTMQRVANRVTAALGKPSFVAFILTLIIIWMIGNYIADQLGVQVLERFPFPDLAFFATIGALVVALLILTTQRYDEALAEKRAQLTLQIAMLGERKTTKIIALLEEQRRDNPLLASRIDVEADHMGRPLDPLEALEKVQAATSNDQAD
ncbi:DUF1003 domain-containing protein [Sphingomonas sp. PAMC 26617]|uniref:DUF1003 domain-containing protein n=1 Tax=Sphingomonas sp. PAMC 26617 TaxID=1112216 RepID=UPI000287F30B|nr:DUF1003 domain-containing protein [Sphingomonas sp. PAMC 26617]